MFIRRFLPTASQLGNTLGRNPSIAQRPGRSNVVHFSDMRTVAELEEEILRLTSAERERLAVAAWESLEKDSADDDGLTDPEGITEALHRDSEIETRAAKPLSEAEFRRLTRDAAD